MPGLGMFQSQGLPTRHLLTCPPGARRISVTGCNVENASYGLTICAERTALVKAVSEGHRNFKAIAIASNMNDLTMPCGACRQFIIEFGKDIVIYAAAADGRVLTKRADELLPLSFGASDLPSK
nr:cytidine deaminase-like isoform X2 [Rhipicephalus microplus]